MARRKVADIIVDVLERAGLLNVHVNRNELVMLPKIEPAMAVGTVIYGAKAILEGRARDVAEMVNTNFRR